MALNFSRGPLAVSLRGLAVSGALAVAAIGTNLVIPAGAAMAQAVINEEFQLDGEAMFLNKKDEVPDWGKFDPDAYSKSPLGGPGHCIDPQNDLEIWGDPEELLSCGHVAGTVTPPPSPADPGDISVKDHESTAVSEMHTAVGPDGPNADKSVIGDSTDGHDGGGMFSHSYGRDMDRRRSAVRGIPHLDDRFFQGSKLTEDVCNWRTDHTSVPTKDDFANVMAAYKQGAAGDPEEILFYGGASTIAPNGTMKLMFLMMQNKLAHVPPACPGRMKDEEVFFAVTNQLCADNSSVFADLDGVDYRGRFVPDTWYQDVLFWDDGGQQGEPPAADFCNGNGGLSLAEDVGFGIDYDHGGKDIRPVFFKWKGDPAQIAVLPESPPNGDVLYNCQADGLGPNGEPGFGDNLKNDDFCATTNSYVFDPDNSSIKDHQRARATHAPKSWEYLAYSKNQRPNGKSLALPDGDDTKEPSDNFGIGLVSTDFPGFTFFEGGMRLGGKMPVAPVCFQTVIPLTVSSVSLEAEMKDFKLLGTRTCAIEVTKTAKDVSKVGDKIEYTVKIKNTGLVTLALMSIKDTLGGDLTVEANYDSSDCGKAGESFPPLKECTIVYTHTVTNTDPDPLLNKVDVVYEKNSIQVTGSATHSVDLITANYTITKDVCADPLITTSGSGPGVKCGSGKDSTFPVTVGDTINYKVVISNPAGNAKLILKSIMDSLEDDLTNAANYDSSDCGDSGASLAAGSSCTIIYPHVVTSAEDTAGIKNTVTAIYRPDGFPNEIEKSAMEFISDDDILPLPGTIKLVKISTGKGAEFDFTHSDGTGSISGLATELTTVAGTGKMAMDTSDSLPPGNTYSIAETPEPSWDLESLKCELQDGTTTGNVSNNEITGIEVKSNETTTCTFTNVQQPQETGLCRVTAGGVDSDGNAIPGSLVDDAKYQFGGQVGANTALANPLPAGEWTHHEKRDFTFHGGTHSAIAGTEITLIRCTDPNPVEPAAANAKWKQLDFIGKGTFSNVSRAFLNQHGVDVTPEPKGQGGGENATIHFFEVNLDDVGEPGNQTQNGCPAEGFGDGFNTAGGQELVEGPPDMSSCPDFYRITIYKDETPNQILYQVRGYLKGGNIQIHDLTGFDKK